MLLRYGKNTEVKQDTSYFPPEMFSVITEHDHVRDLGIQVSNSADFNYHIDTIVKKTRK